jgi:hypothetical protein
MRHIASEVGYRALCIGRIGLAQERGDPFSLNRVSVKRTMGETQFRALLRYDWMTLASMRSRQWIRELARERMSVESYLRLRRLLMGTTRA